MAGRPGSWKDKIEVHERRAAQHWHAAERETEWPLSSIVARAR
jgi:hypothetical protein